MITINNIDIEINCSMGVNENCSQICHIFILMSESIEVIFPVCYRYNLVNTIFILN